MSIIVILPTFDLVSECQSYDNLYRIFIPGGVKSIIRESVLLTSKEERNAYTTYRRSLQNHHNVLVDYVLKRFDDYMDAKCQAQFDHLANDIRGEEFDIAEFLARTNELELITQVIDEQVLEMMRSVFKDTQYVIEDDSAHWREKDLEVALQRLIKRGFYGA